MHRFVVPPENCRGVQIVLPDAEAHHARQVLRLRPGDAVTVLDGAGQDIACVVASTERRAIVLRVERREMQPPLPWDLTLFPAVTKPRSMEWLVQKATELGVTRIRPILTERTVPQFDADGAARKAEKWRTIAVEAIKQCGSPWLPDIAGPVDFAAAVAGSERGDLSLVGSLAPIPESPGQAVRRFNATHGRRPARVSFWVGPEGDFTAGELDALRLAGVQAVTLGPLVLRSETAALAALAILRHELAELSAPG